jgi:hypothetical protein
MKSGGAEARPPLRPTRRAVFDLGTALGEETSQFASPGGSRDTPYMANSTSRPGIGELHHVELWVPDLGRATASWGWLLGALGYELSKSGPRDEAGNAAAQLHALVNPAGDTELVAPRGAVD